MTCLQEDAPIKVHSDEEGYAPESLESHVATAEAPTPGTFLRAAQREHINEAAALRQLAHEVFYAVIGHTLLIQNDNLPLVAAGGC